jgi:hypothetical protein
MYMKRLLLAGVTLLISANAAAYTIHVANATDREVVVRFDLAGCADESKVVPASTNIDYNTHGRFDATKLGCGLNEIRVTSSGLTGSAKPLGRFSDSQFLIEYDKSAQGFMITPFKDWKSSRGSWESNLSRARENARRIQAADQGQLAALRAKRDNAIDRLDPLSFALHSHSYDGSAYNAEIHRIKEEHNREVEKLLQLDFKTSQWGAGTQWGAE